MSVFLKSGSHSLGSTTTGYDRRTDRREYWHGVGEAAVQRCKANGVVLEITTKHEAQAAQILDVPRLLQRSVLAPASSKAWTIARLPSDAAMPSNDSGM